MRTMFLIAILSLIVSNHTYGSDRGDTEPVVEEMSIEKYQVVYVKTWQSAVQLLAREIQYLRTQIDLMVLALEKIDENTSKEEDICPQCHISIPEGKLHFHTKYE